MSEATARKRREITPTLVLLVITSVSYAVSVVGLGLTLGGWLGWVAFLVGSLIPAAYLLPKAAEDRSIERDRQAQRGETYRPPEDEGAPEALPPMR